jgi:hypothetical protein
METTSTTPRRPRPAWVSPCSLLCSDEWMAFLVLFSVE